MEQTTFFCRQDSAPSLSDDIRDYVMWCGACVCFQRDAASYTWVGMSFPNDMPPTLKKDERQT